MNPYLISVNILPKSIDYIKEQIMIAVSLGYRQAWINPISNVEPKTLCHRRNLDTGVMDDLYDSLYAVNSLMDIRFNVNELKKLNQQVKKNFNGFPILTDFVWKHVGNQSPLIKKYPNWFKKDQKNNLKIFNDICEFNFDNDKYFDEIIQYIKNSIDFYLNDCGFAGLRVDAVSHMPANVRNIIIPYIRSKYPDAIILEEILFDDKQSSNIDELLENGITNSYQSDFVTSNLYYQTPDCFGGLPRPEDMGDRKKLQLGKNAISFTGNHDHYSLSWSVLFTLAAQFIIKDTDYLNFLATFKATDPIKNEPSVKEQFQKISHYINEIASGSILVESITSGDQHIIKYLIPVVHEIIRTILIELKSNEKKPMTNKFSKLLFQRLIDRTLVSPNGYFTLASDMNLNLSTQRIFTHNDFESMITAQDLANLKLNAKDFNNLLQEVILAYPNLANTLKNYSTVEFTPRNKKNNKINKKPNKKVTKANDDKENDDSLNELRTLVPLIQNYLNKTPSAWRYFPKINFQESELELKTYCGYSKYLQSINEIFSMLTTHGSHDYHTFVSLDKYKIVVRCTDKNTDIIVMNLDPYSEMELDMIDLQKIAIWFQSKLFPPTEEQRGDLSSPLDKKPIQYNKNGYGSFDNLDAKNEFDFAWNRILGEVEGHSTNLYLGPGIKPGLLESVKIKYVGPTMNPADELVHGDRMNAWATNPNFFKHSLFGEKTSPLRPAAKPDKTTNNTNILNLDSESKNEEHLERRIEVKRGSK